jgi:hypothetical protein
MALTVGTNTYISLADADAYLSATYPATDAKMVAWTTLSDADCEIYLKRAALILDRQAYTGQKAVSTQAMQFPRAIYAPNSSYAASSNYIFDNDWYVQTEVPTEVKYAQVEIAFAEAQGTSSRVQLQREGVKSFSLGKLSESYGSGSVFKMSSPEAYDYLAPYLAGSVRLC